MAEEVFIKKSILNDIADAIREKNGRTDTYMPYEFSSAIDELANIEISDLEAYMRGGEIIYSGYEGDCPWALTDHGTLVIGDPEKTTFLSEAYLSNPWSNYNALIKNIVVNGKVVVPANMVNMFSGMQELWLIFNIGNLDTSLVKSYQGWFQGCNNINTIDLTSWDASNVRNLNWMFKSCSSLVEVKLPTIYHECEMIGMFSQCGFVNFRFFGDKVLRSSNMSQMFSECPNLVECNLQGIDISKISYMQETFAYCPNLTTVNIEPIFAPNLVSMKHMFRNCYSLKKNPKNLFWKVPSLTDVSFMFQFCISLEEFEFDTPVFSIKNISGMFSECYQLKKIDWTNWINFFYNGEETLHANSPFHNCWNLQELITGSRTMLSTKGWQIAHYDAYAPKITFQTVEGIKPSITNYTEVNTMTSSSAFMGYNISGVPGYDLLNSVEAGLRIDWRMSYTEAVTQEVMDLTTGNMVQEGMFTNMNSQYTPAVNLPYSDYIQDKYLQAYIQDLFKLAVEGGLNKDAAASLVGLDQNRDGYLKNIGLALPYYMIEQNTGIRTYQLNLNQACHYIREDTIIESEPYYKYPSMHNFLSQNFSKNFAGKTVKHIEWRTNVQIPLSNALPARVDDYGKKTYSNSLSWEYDHDTKTLIVATPEDEFYLAADSSGMFSGMIYLEDFSFEKINAKYCCNYAYMFNDDVRLKEITHFAMNPAIDRQELIPFQDPCNEINLEDISNYRKVHKGYDTKYYDWYYIYGIDTMFRGCSDLRLINFSEVDWGRLKTINRATNDYSSILRTALSKYIPTAEIVIIDKMYEKTDGYEQLTTDEPWYRLPLGNTNEVIVSQYNKEKVSIIPNYNISVTGLIDGPGKYIRHRAVTPELWERSYGMDDNIFYSGMSLRHMIDDYLGSKNLTAQDLKRLDFRTRIVTPHGTQYTVIKNEIEYIGPYLYYNEDTQALIIQTRAENFIIKDNAEYTFYDMREMRRIRGFEKIKWENITNISHFFDGCLSLITVNLSTLELENLTDTSYMFNNCLLFDYIDLSTFNFSQVTDMEYMFNNCTNLVQLILPENIDTSQVTDMTHLFCNCEKLGLIDFKDFDTDNVIDMSYMFYNCKELLQADLSNFNTLNVKDMSYMFTGCDSLRKIDISSIIFCRKKDYIFTGLDDSIFEQLTAQFNLENIYFNNLFEGCLATQLDLSRFNWHMARDMKKMFKDCINLQSLDMGDVESPWVYSLNQMFYNCESLQSIIFTRWRTKGVTDVESMFENCKSLVDLDFVKMDFHERLVKASMMFKDCENLLSLDMSNCYLYCNFDRIFYNCKSLTAITNLHGQYARPLGYSFYWRKSGITGRFFYNCESLVDLDLSYFRFDDLYDYSYLFYNCKSLKVINTKYSLAFNGMNYTSMFEDCEQAEEIILPDKINMTIKRIYDTRNGYYRDTQARFTKMFKNCYNVEKISNLKIIDKWGTITGYAGANPTHWYLGETFYNCNSLLFIDLDKLISNANKTSMWSSSETNYHAGYYNDMNITEMYGTFYNCWALQYLHFPSDREMHFESYTIDIHDTFNGCKSLTDFYFENLHFNHRDQGLRWQYNNQEESDKYYYNLSGLFKDCQSLTQIDLSTWWFNTYHNIAQTTGLPYNNSGNLGITNENIGNMESMFENCYNLEKIIWPNGTKSTGVQPTYDLVTGTFPWMYIKNANKMFKNCYKLEEIQQEAYPEIIFNTVVSAYQMMMNCKSIDINIVLLCSNYLRDMREIFSGCESMTYLDFRKHRTLFNYTEKENGLYNCLAMQQMDMGQFYDGRTRRFYLDIDNEDNYSLRIGWIAGARGDEYIYLPVTPGYDDPPNYRPYIGLDVSFWNEILTEAKNTNGKYLWFPIGGWANQNANSSIGSSGARILNNIPLYYSNWTTYQGGWVVPSGGSIAYEWDRAPIMNIDSEVYLIQRKDTISKSKTNLRVTNMYIDNYTLNIDEDFNGEFIMNSYWSTWNHDFSSEYEPSLPPLLFWKGESGAIYELNQEIEFDIVNSIYTSAKKVSLKLVSQDMINFLNTDPNLYDYYLTVYSNSIPGGSNEADLWRTPKGIQNEFVNKDGIIWQKWINNLFAYSGEGGWDGTRPVQWYALLETEKCPYINLNEWGSEEDIYPMQFPKNMYTGVQNMYIVWNGDIPVKVETYYDFPLLPEKYNSRLVSGSEFAYTIKRMANGANVTDGNFEDTKIKHIVFENGVQKSGTAIGSQGSPVVANWDNDTGTITITFEVAAPIILNANSSNMFYRLKGLQSVEGLDILDTSEVLNANGMFREMGTSSLELDLRTWDVSNCQSMQFIFRNCIANLINITDWDITNLTDIPNWDSDFSFFYDSTIGTLEAENLDFSNITNLRGMLYRSTFTNINIANWNVSNITSFRGMFNSSTFTNGLDLSTWDISSVRNMINTFANMNAPWILFDTWDTSAVTDMTYMFGGCKVPEINISTWDVTSVTTMYQMFRETAASLTTITLSGLDTSAVTSMYQMFYNCRAQTIILNELDTSAVTSMYQMFYNCQAQVITLNGLDISAVTSMYQMFYGTNVLQNLNIEMEWVFNSKCDIREMFNGSTCIINSLERLNVSYLVSMYRMFYGYRGIELIFTNWNTSNTKYMSEMFAECTNLTTLKIQTFDTSKVFSFEAMFYNCSKLEIFETNSFVISANDRSSSFSTGSGYNIGQRKVNTSSYRDWGSFNNGYSAVGEMFLNIKIPLNIGHWDVSRQINFSTMFGGYKGTIIDLSQWNILETTKNIIWRMMFNNCSNLQYVYLTSFWTDNVSDMAAMFANCTSLIKAYFRENKLILPSVNSNAYGIYVGCTCDLHLEEWDVYKLTSWHSLFRSYRGTTIDLSSWENKYTDDIITSANAMFYDCNNLTTLILGGFSNQKIIKDFGASFAFCSNLVTIDITSIHTDLATSFSSMFYACTKLETLDFSNFSTENITTMYRMFYDCQSLQELDLTSFNTIKCSDFNQMFYNCKSLQHLLISNFNTSLWSGDNAAYMFRYCESLEELYLPDTFTMINNTSAERMFQWCYALQSIRIPETFGGANLQRVDGMFEGCNVLEELTFPDSFISQKCTNFEYMFQHCYALKILNQHFNTVNAVLMRCMFQNCYALEELDTHQMDNGFSMSKVTDCCWMFNHCRALKSLDLHTCSLPKAGTEYRRTSDGIKGMFSNCYSLEVLNIPTLFSPDGGCPVNYINNLFSNCKSLTTLNISNANFKNLSSGGATYIFSGCESLKSIDLKYSKFIGINSMQGWFQNCYELNYIDWFRLTVSTNEADISPINNMSYLFQNCKAITKVKFLENSGVIANNMEVFVTEINMTTWNVSNVTNIDYMFAGCDNLVSVDWAYSNFIQIRNSQHTFEDCISLIEVIFPENYNEKIVNGNEWYIDYMFANCSSLTYFELPYIKLTTAYYNRMTYLFSGCINLEAVEFKGVQQFTDWADYATNCLNNCPSLKYIYFSECSGWLNNKFIKYICNGANNSNSNGINAIIEGSIHNNFSEFCRGAKKINKFTFLIDTVPTTLYAAFLGTGLTNLDDIINLDMSIATDYRSIFQETAITIGDTRHWNIRTNQDCNFESAFYNSSMTEIDLTHFTISAISNFNYSFRYCSKLTSIIIPQIPAGVYGMFWNQSALRNIEFYNFNDTNKIRDILSSVSSGERTINVLLNHFYGTALSFNGYSCIKDFNIINSDTSLITNLANCFNGTRISSFNFDLLDISNVTNMQAMFANNGVLTEIEINNVISPRVTNVESMFYGCSALKKLDFSTWTCSAIQNFQYMFRYCTNLETLDISGWDFNSLTSAYGMFWNTGKLKTLYIRGAFKDFKNTSDASLSSAGLTDIYAPLSLIDRYKQANQWKNFSSIIKDGSNKDLVGLQIKASTMELNCYRVEDFHPTSQLTPVYIDPDGSIDVDPIYRGVIWSIEQGDVTIDENGLLTLNSGQDEDIVIIKAISTYNNEIEATINIRLYYIEQYYIIDLNDNEWIDSGTIQEGNIVYYSNKHKGQNSTRDSCIITIFGYNTFILKYCSYGEANYDYVWIGLDKTPNSLSDSNYNYTTKGNSNMTYKTATFNNLDGNQHTISIVYKKDGSQSHNNDRGYFYIPEQTL